MDRSRVVVAEVVRVRGNKGEVLARSQTDIPGRLEKLGEAWLHLADGPDRLVAIESAWATQRPLGAEVCWSGLD